MTIQVVVSNFEDKYPRRGDRLREEPSAKNAQGLFLPDACIFVGNLSTKVCTDDLAEDLKKIFTEFGPCHVKIKQDKKKGLPGAFVQFEKVEDASAALANDERVILHDRWLRIERAKGRRTACLGLRSGAPITSHDVSFALEGRGPLEAYCIESYPIGPQTWTLISKVTFAYVDDCRDAIKYFQKDDKYYLTLLDMDGSPMLLASGHCVPFRSRDHNAFQPGRNDNSSRNIHNNRPPRNGSSRGHHRGGEPRHRQNLQQNERFPPPHLRGSFPGQPIWMSSLPYNHELTQPSYPPTLFSYPNDPYGSIPFIVDSQPRFDHFPLSPLPGTYVPNGPGGPLIVSSQSPYDGNSPAIYHDPFTPESGFLSPPSSNASQQSGSVMQPNLKWTHQPKSEPLAPSYEQHKVTTPPTAVEKPDEDPKEDNLIEKLLEANRQEKPPKLIRVYESDEEAGVSEASTKRTESEKANLPVLGDNSVKETKEKNKEAAAQERSETQTTKLTYESAHTSDSDKSVSGRFQQQYFDRSHDGASTRDLDSISTLSCSRYRSCSPPSYPVNYAVSSSSLNDSQPKTSIKGGKTIEEYVRCMAEQRDGVFSETVIQDVIVSLETEQNEKDMEMAKRKVKIPIDSESSRSRSCSLTRTASSKSV